MTIQYNYSLEAHNTFGIQACAKAFIEVTSDKALKNVLNKNNLPVFILGGGSNLLLTQDLPFLVIKNGIKGKQIIAEKEEEVFLKIGGGENWHQLVLWCLERDFGGIENLSLIPGTVGAAPIQNIGAYGVELENVFHQLEAIELATGKLEVFTKKDCQFAYRNSVFKQYLKGKYCITQVVLRLSKKNHRIHSSYGAIQQLLSAKNIAHPSIQDISQVVIAIRSSKLPDPKVWGNSGSFFKNPEIEQPQFENLQAQFPQIVFYKLPSGKVKIPAAWLIEQCGWKGKRIGNAGSHAQQALVLVNYGGATGQEIWNLAIKIKESVKNKFGIKLKPEVNVF